jgi:hypothetical protein
MRQMTYGRNRRDDMLLRCAPDVVAHGSVHLRGPSCSPWLSFIFDIVMITAPLSWL